MFELDHLFIWSDIGGPQADRLATIGLTEGEPNTHPGQGTACRRFFFRNAYLELLWMCDPAAAKSELVQPTGLWHRWTGQASGASPFGVCLRPARHQGGGEHNDPPAIPFRGWAYRPPYLPADLAIHVAEAVPASEPC